MPEEIDDDQRVCSAGKASFGQTDIGKESRFLRWELISSVGVGGLIASTAAIQEERRRDDRGQGGLRSSPIERRTAYQAPVPITHYRSSQSHSHRRNRSHEEREVA